VRFDTYDPGDFYDELFAAGSTSPRSCPVNRKNQFLISRTPAKTGGRIALFKLGVTFNVYGDDQGQNESCPLISFPIVSVQEWARLNRVSSSVLHKSFWQTSTSRELSKTALSLRNLFTLPVVLQALHGSAARWNLVYYRHRFGPRSRWSVVCPRG